MKARILAAGAAVALTLSALAACSSSSPGATTTPTGTDKPYAGTTLTYWATNQAATLDADTAILQPELDKFEQQTGIHVNLQVVGWSDITNNTLQAAVAGQGPDVVNIGNTNATTLQATGAFLPFDAAALDAIGGQSKFLASAWSTAGPAGQDPTSVPLYSQVYGLFCNNALFSAANLTPPTTWEDLVADAKAITDSSTGTWGIVAPAGTQNVSMHIQYIFANQNGGSPFLTDGTPNFDTPENVAAVSRYVSLMTDGYMNPSDAQYNNGVQATNDFATGKAGMYMAQVSNVAALQTAGMDPTQYTIVPIPAPAASPASGKTVGSFIAGTNMSIFSYTQHKDAALAFVNFMTSPTEQEILNKAYGTLSPVSGVPADAFSQYPDMASAWQSILQNNSIPMALVSTVSAYQTNVGNGVIALFAQAATGSPVSDADIQTMLDQAQQKMTS